MNYKIKQGDCLELMKNLPDHSIDMILADLPYGILSTEKWDQCLPLESQDRFDDEQKFPKDIIYFSNRRQKSYHPTQKPVRLLEYLIQTYTEEGDTVLDNTMGSGSTGVAALVTKRKFIGYELESNFYQIAKRRIEDESKSDIPYLPPRLLDVDRLDNQQPKIPSWVLNL